MVETSLITLIQRRFCVGVEELECCYLYQGSLFNLWRWLSLMISHYNPMRSQATLFKAGLTLASLCIVLKTTLYKLIMQSNIQFTTPTLTFRHQLSNLIWTRLSTTGSPTLLLPKALKWVAFTGCYDPKLGVNKWGNSKAVIRSVRSEIRQSGLRSITTFNRRKSWLVLFISWKKCWKSLSSNDLTRISD